MHFSSNWKDVVVVCYVSVCSWGANNYSEQEVLCPVPRGNQMAVSAPLIWAVTPPVKTGVFSHRTTHGAVASSLHPPTAEWLWGLRALSLVGRAVGVKGSCGPGFPRWDGFPAVRVVAGAGWGQRAACAVTVLACDCTAAVLWETPLQPGAACNPWALGQRGWGD